jgi:hypothetical protein
MYYGAWSTPEIGLINARRLHGGRRFDNISGVLIVPIDHLELLGILLLRVGSMLLYCDGSCSANSMPLQVREMKRGSVMLTRPRPVSNGSDSYECSGVRVVIHCSERILICGQKRNFPVPTKPRIRHDQV